jgi:Ser/Thr protein kinase RdoA (MazF antagonist)
VKVWPRDPPETLGAAAHLDLPVPVPVHALDGRLHATLDDGDGRAFGVFPFLPGRHATRDDWAVIARALRQLHEHPVIDALPPIDIREPCIESLRARLDHPWIRDQADLVARNVDRLEAAIEVARARTDVPVVICHRDFGGWNLLVDDDGRVTGMLDWDYATIGPREHDVWIAFEEADPVAFLEVYGARDLDLAHLEVALLARALRDMCARVELERDRDGIEPWGFARLERLDRDLAQAKRFS